MSHKVGKLKLAGQKLLGFIIVVFVLAFIAYHLFSVSRWITNFHQTTGLNSTHK